MDWGPHLSELQRVLYDLYRDEASARRLAREAGLAEERIDWAGNGLNRWHAVLVEARKSGLVAAICDRAQREYPRHHPLQQVVRRLVGSTAHAAVAGSASGTAAPFLDLNTARVEDLKGRVDFAIITIKKEELQAVLDQFHCQAPKVVPGARDYAVVQVSRIGRTNDGDGSALVAITRCPTQGNGVSQDVARDIIDELDPQWILVVGIAGGAPATEFTLGDVVLGTSVLDFSVEAVKAGGDREFAVEGRHVHASVENYATLVDAHAAALGPWYELTVGPPGSNERVPLPQPPIEVQPDHFYGSATWQEKVQESLMYHQGRQPRRPRVTAVPIASSDRLIKDDEIMTIWLQVARHVRAVEMESAGVYIAARGRGNARKSYPVMSIRGISDIIGFKRHEDWTRYACESAAAFAYAFVRSQQLKAQTRWTNRAQ